MVTVFIALAWLSIRDKSATYDEPLHLSAAYLQSQELDFRCDPENPPLWKYYATAVSQTHLPTHRDEPIWAKMLQDPSQQWRYSADALYHTPGIDADTLLRAARRRMIAVGAALAVAIAWWAWQLGGRWSAMVATTLFCLDPNFLAHTPLVKNDVSITLAFVLLMIGVRQVGIRLTVPRFLFMALLLGVAVTTKFSGLLGIFMVAAAFACRALMPEPWTVLGRWVHGRSRRLLVAAGATFLSILIAWGCIWLCYGLRFAPTSDALFQMGSVLSLCCRNERLVHTIQLGLAASMQQQIDLWNAQWQPGLFVRMLLASCRLKLLPQAWAFGLVSIYSSSLFRRAFLCGEMSFVGWWCYFPLAMLFKTPMATLASIASAAGMGLVCFRKRNIFNWNLISLVVAPVIYFAVALRTHLNIGFRHILPIYPFLFIACGVMAAQALRRWPRPTIVALASLALFLGIETGSAYPDYIPFFNIASGGARGGVALLGDSNLDWGQELPALAEWMKAHPHRQLWLCYFGSADPKYYHLHYVMLPGSLVGWPDQSKPSADLPVIALSARVLQGDYLTPDEYKAYAPFRQQQPIAVLGGALYLFDPVKVPETP
jgi:hypothetical protein